MPISKARRAKDPTRKLTEQLLTRLDKAKREEDVKAAWAKCFDFGVRHQPEFRIATWDAGWWQARSVLADAGLAATEMAALKQAHDALKAKLLPQLAPLGFLG